MRNRNKNKILFLADGTAICKYCGEKLKVKNRKDLNEYDKYECDCKKWKEALEVEKEIDAINNDFYEKYMEYRSNIIQLINTPDDLCIKFPLYEMTTKENSI